MKIINQLTEQLYNDLLPLKTKWEIWKLTKSANININDRVPLSAAYKHLFGFESDWCCAESVATNFNLVMDQFDDYADKNYMPVVEVVIPTKKFKRGK